MAGLLNNSVIFLILLVGLNSCSVRVSEKKMKTYTIINSWKEKPVGIHQEISPKYKAVLNNGDTISCSSYPRVGSTVYYKYFKNEKSDI